MTTTPPRKSKPLRASRRMLTMSAMVDPLYDELHFDDDCETNFEEHEATPAPKAKDKPQAKAKATSTKKETRTKKPLSATGEKRKRGRPVGSVSKTEEQRVEQAREYRDRVLQVYPNPRLNELTSEMLCDDPVTGKERKISDKEPSLVGTRCTIDNGLYVPDREGRLILLSEADKNAFNPVECFLDKARQTTITSEGKALWENLGYAVTGREDEHYNKTMKALLVAAVARTKSPGASVPFMPILEGGQGVGKSSLLKKLVPLEFRAELNSMPDQLLSDPCRLHVGWLIEFPECDRLFKPSQIENLKTLITVDCDSTRRPYAELPIKLPRKFVLLGTTNSKEFLVDTENRRFPILSIAPDWEIQLDQIAQHNMELWHLAQLAYESGFDWIPSKGDLQSMAHHQTSYQSRDPWSALIFRYIIDKDRVSPQAILESVIELSKKEMTVSHSRRVTKILRQFGWERLGVRKVNGVSVRLYQPGPNWDPKNIDL